MGYDKDNPKFLRTFYDVKPPIEVLKQFKKEYTLSLCAPSVSSSFSVCVEYMMKWFKSKFQRDFFKSEFVSNRNILRDFMDKSVMEHVKRNKPSLAVAATPDFTYNRNMTDFYEYGKNIYANRMRFNDVFFVNPVTKNMVSLSLEQMKVDFSFRVKVNSYNTGVDLYKFIQLACRSNASETRHSNIDFQIPKTLMIAIAKDSGFELNSTCTDVKDICQFLRFLNKNSRLPIVYKMRGTKGEKEYFMKMTNMYIHLRAGDVDLENGERTSQTENDFVVSIQVECLFPVPKFYAYYGKAAHSFTMYDNTLKYNIFNIYIGNVPLCNDKGWNQFMQSDYAEDYDTFKKKQPSVINFTELIKSDDSNSLFDIAEDFKRIFISPAAFMDIKLFNNNEDQPIDIDWNTYTITTKNVLKEQLSEFVIYVDLEFINNYKINVNKGLSTRIEDNHNYV